jgi:hypothetical protein
LDSIAFQLWIHKLEPEVRMNQATLSLTDSQQKLLQFSFPPYGKSLICGTPLGGSRELIKLPFHAVGWDLTMG